MEERSTWQDRQERRVDRQELLIESVCDLFRGQETCRTEFTVTLDLGRQMALTGMESDLGIGNRLQLLDDEIVANLNDIQLRNGLAPSTTLASGDFTVEMETGTGKTYVYLRTVFELNKRYGFTKFVIAVPSVAIKEGVYKTLQITAVHFLPFGAARGLGQPERLPDLRHPGHRDRTGTPADHRAGAAAVRQPDGRTAARIRHPRDLPSLRDRQCLP